MIDTNIFDKLVMDSLFPDIWDALQAELIEFNTTEIQEAEISQISDKNFKRLLNSIPRKVMPLVTPEIGSDSKHENDLIIATTAAKNSDIFVTKDKGLHEWYQAHYPGNNIFSYREFIAWFLREVFIDTFPL